MYNAFCLFSTIVFRFVVQFANLLELLVFGLHPREHDAEHLLQACLRRVLINGIVCAQMYLRTVPPATTIPSQEKRGRSRLPFLYDKRTLFNKVNLYDHTS